MRLTKVWLAVAAALGVAASVRAPVAIADPGNCSIDKPPPPSARIVHTKLDGLSLNVLLPAGYTSSGRRYPVLYLLHGADYNENTWLDESDLAHFTAGFTGARAVIVVMPDGGPMGWYVDWYQGDEQWETYHLRRLVPFIDKHFRTRANQAHRAVAGFSIGGFGAAGYAARHPDLFSVVGSFSGLDHYTTPDRPYTGPGPTAAHRSAGHPGAAYRGRPKRRYRPPDDNGSGCGPSSGSATGDPVTDRVVWHGRNPTDLASNLRGTSVYLYSGNGVACDAADALQQPNFGFGLEPAVRQMNTTFDAALTAAGVPHKADFRSCGLHTMRYAERALHAFWPFMAARFGRRTPKSFSMRSIDPDFSAYGWSFHADPKRALEFLEVTGAGSHGFTLTGSGTETVITPRLFKPHQRIAIRGALPRRATVGRSRRLTLRVDLGAADTTKQFAPGSQPNFLRRVVRLHVIRARG